MAVAYDRRVDGRLVGVGDTRLYVVERGSGYPLIVLHGGPGCDHRMFGDYLDPLGDEYRLLLVDQRAQGRSERPAEETWTLERMAADVPALADTLGLGTYAVLGHSYGAIVALQNAVDFPGAAAQTIVSSGVPSASYLAEVDANLAAFEPVELRERVTQSWAREKHVTTHDEVATLMSDQLPFHFGDPLDPRIPDYELRMGGAVYSPEVLRRFANEEYGGIEVEDRLGDVTHPVLVMAGRHDRTCAVGASGEMAPRLPNGQLVVFENSAHMMFAEQPDHYLATVREFLDRVTA